MAHDPLSDELLDRVRQAIERRRNVPESTYRLQFHAGFTFRDATAIVPYLHDLGVTHCYASPYFKATPGSKHGYDVIDPQRLNPEIGTEEDYAAWIDAMKRLGMGHILDVVPNHAGVGTNDNAWWNDVLENGPGSRFARFFDIDWHASTRLDFQNKVLLPLLRQPYAQVLEAGQLKLGFDKGAFSVSYYDRTFPISLQSYPMLLGEGEAAQSIQRGAEPGSAKRRLADLAARMPELRARIDKTLAQFNGTPGEPASFDRLDRLLGEQWYRLAYWRVAPDEINYRRFFDINDLAALRMEEPEVFDSIHALVLSLLAQGRLQGVRIDHPDGLYDPRQYLSRLQKQYLLACAKADGFELSPEQVEAFLQRIGAGPPADWPLYGVVEKILALGESLPADWEVGGTSGYDFLNHVNGLFVAGENERVFTQIYRQWIGEDQSYDDLIYQKKRLILHKSFASELHTLARRLTCLAQKSRGSRDFTEAGLRKALAEIIACFPVYRSYITSPTVSQADRRHVETSVRNAIARNPATEPAIFHFIQDMLLQRHPRGFDQQDESDQLRFAGKFQQLTAPVTAKGIEDTAFYIFNRLVSLNEVGGDPNHFGASPDELHAYLADRQQRWPGGFSPLSTHDTKRSEDVRARINVLSEVPDEWFARASRWREINAAHRGAVDANDEYLLYQTLIGAWPLGPYDRAAAGPFTARIVAYMEKALREAKVRTSWTMPNADYEAAVEQFVERILNPELSAEFLDDFIPFQRRVSRCGMFNSLSQTLLRIAAPGVPDTYQGTELWDFSLVDPDNRRPVDYGRRAQMLGELKSDWEAAGANRAPFLRKLLDDPADGRVKLLVTWLGLSARRSTPGLFSAGDSFPLQFTGPGRGRLFGFARRHGELRAVVIVPRLVAGLIWNSGDPPIGPGVWEDTRLQLPPGFANGSLTDLFTSRQFDASREGTEIHLPIAQLLADFPVTLLM